jgi:hypothetical protein
VPPLLWIALALDSGANKSGIMSALSDIASSYEKSLFSQECNRVGLQPEDAVLEAEAPLEDEAEVDPREAKGKKAEAAAQARKRKHLAANPPTVVTDEGSLPAIGTQLCRHL